MNLVIEGLNARYGSTQVLWDVSLRMDSGEVVAVVGPNGSGKSTILKSIVGLVKTEAEAIVLDDLDLTRVPTHKMISHGLGFVLERRRLFPNMTVGENIAMGAYDRRARRDFDRNLEWVESLLPIVRERRNQKAGLMSGGEQQMVAIARGLISRPKILLMDEPFLGLAPIIIQDIVKIMKQIQSEGISIMFNEQNVHLSFSLSDRGYLLESGRIVTEGTGLEMLDNKLVKEVYLGV